jgi:hypothetical protein
MSTLVDTCVWSLALRRARPERHPAVDALARRLTGGDPVFTTGMILQELLQGFRGPRQERLIVQQLSLLPLLVPSREDHIEAAHLRNACRRRGIQVTTIDALIAQLCLRHGLELLTTDQDFARVARLFPLRLISAG